MSAIAGQSRGEASLLQCLAHGTGQWHQRATPAYYTLTSSFLEFNQSKYNWGKCGVEAYTHQWEPTGEGCSALPTVQHLVAEFQRLYHEKLVLVVGDSTQGQFFTSLAHTVGFNVSATVHDATSCPDTRPTVLRNLAKHRQGNSTQYQRSKLMADFHDQDVRSPYAHEHDELLVTERTRLGLGRVKLQFIRNDRLSFASNRDVVAKSKSAVSWDGWRCSWLAEAKRADLLVLNVGFHWLGLPPLNATLAALRKVMKVDAEVIVRGLHAPNCDGEVRTSPRLPADYAAVYSRYNWNRLEPWNAEFKRSCAREGAHFLDVWPLSDSNGRARFDPPADCVHQCQPGPIDEWSKLFLVMAVDLRTRKRCVPRQCHGDLRCILSSWIGRGCVHS